MMPPLRATTSFLRPLCAVLALQPWACQAAEEPIVLLGAAIERGGLAAVEKLLAAGVNPNTRVPDAWLNYTPLFLAVKAKRPAITQALLKAGADPSIEDGNGDPVMVMAANPVFMAQARLLIEHRVSIDSRNSVGIPP